MNQIECIGWFQAYKSHF